MSWKKDVAKRHVPCRSYSCRETTDILDQNMDSVSKPEQTQLLQPPINRAQLNFLQPLVTVAPTIFLFQRGIKAFQIAKVTQGR